MLKPLYNLSKKVLPQGYFYQVRYHLVSDNAKLLGPLLKAYNTTNPDFDFPALDKKVIVIGSGLSAVVFSLKLKSSGYKFISIISRDGQFGGKCVSEGCMPSELFFSHSDSGLPLDDNDFSKMSDFLGGHLKHKAESKGIKIIKANAEKVDGRQITLSSGDVIDFDLLVIATGSKYSDHESYQGQINFHNFWRLKSGRLVLISKSNLNMLSLAEIAFKKNLDVTLYFSDKIALSHLPSVAKFIRELKSQGLEIIDDLGSLAVAGKSIVYTQNGKIRSKEFDYLLRDDNLTLNLMPIDSKKYDLSEINYNSFNLKSRPDIFVLGDAAGLMSVSEGELQADLLAQVFRGHDISDELSGLQQLPIRIHSKVPLAMTGAPYTFLKSTWHQIDFKQLGYTYIHKSSGLIWFLFDPKSKCVEAVHIYHEKANELIAMAQLLIPIPVTDIRWRTPFVHPSAGEIFVQVRDYCLEMIFDKSYKPREKNRPKVIHHKKQWCLPKEDPAACHLFSNEELVLGRLVPDPGVYFRLVLGIKNFKGIDNKATVVLMRDKDGRYQYPSCDSFQYSCDSHTPLVEMTLNEQEAVIL